ncbi:MAG: DUF1846 domain-containing protein [Spirochaetota bacterium]
MPTRIGFDNDLYLAEQTAAIDERLKKFDGKLYLEFGGKILYDYHAARVLPGFDPNVKMRLLQKLKELRGCEVHITHIPTPGDEAGLRRLGVNLTSDPNFSTKNLFIS